MWKVQQTTGPRGRVHPAPDQMFPVRDVESCEGREPRSIAFERHECGILRKQSFDSKVTKMEPVVMGSKFFSGPVGANYQPIVTPQQNTAGLVIRTSELFAVQIFTGAVKPTPLGESLNPSLQNSGPAKNATLSYPIQIPPGFGIWLNPLSTNGTAWITYDIL